MSEGFSPSNYLRPGLQFPLCPGCGLYVLVTRFKGLFTSLATVTSESSALSVGLAVLHGYHRHIIWRIQFTRCMEEAYQWSQA